MENRVGRQRAYIRENNNINYIIQLLVVFCIMCRLGFPGNLAMVFGGDSINLAIDYGSSFLQLILIMLCSGSTILDIKLFEVKRKHLPIYLMMLAMFAVSFMVTDDRAKQATIIIRFSITAIFGIWLADNYEPGTLLNLIYMAHIGIVIANLLTLFVFRNAGYHYDEGYGYTFRGLYTQKNGLGIAFAYGIALQAMLYRIKKAKKQPVSFSFLAVFVVQLMILFYSKATTAIFTALVPIAYLWVYDKMGNPKLRIQWGFIYAVVSIGFIIIALTVIPLFAPLLEAMGKDATLSNRTPMWENIINFMQKSHTLTGYGLLQFWETPSALKDLHNMFGRNTWYREMAYGAHNQLLEMWLDVGLVGVAVYLFTMIYCFRNTARMTPEQYAFCSVLMLPNLISGLTDRHYSNANYFTLFFFLMLGVACSLPKNETRPRRLGAARTGAEKSPAKSP